MKRYLITIWTLVPLVLLGQTPKSLTESTREEFETCRSKELGLLKNKDILKKDKTIIIKPKKGKTIKFEDNLTDENYQTYEYIGDIIKDRIAIIKTQDYNSDRFISIDILTGDQKVMIGYPHILGNNIICLQGAETDVTQDIEYWKIKDNELTKINTFNLGDKVYPADIVWKNEKEIIIKDSKGTFWKTNVNMK